MLTVIGAKIADSTRFQRAYALFGFLVLLITTGLWSALGASLQNSNADQLVNTFLLQNSETFHNATLPAAHTFLLKLPIFWLINKFSLTPHTFIVFTVALSLVTVGLLAGIVYRIDKRPLVFGTICLALASCLLLVPAQPYPGGILPVNMAMLTTRNIEYLFYLASLFFILRARGFRDWRFWLGAIILGILISSDKLFITLGLGAAILSMAIYVLAGRWRWAKLANRWLIGGLLAVVLSLLILNLLNSYHVVHISSQAGLGPFGLNHGFKNYALGLIYAGLGLFTNFGANPAFDATEVRHIIPTFFHRLISAGGPEFLINILFLLVALYASFSLLFASLRSTRNTQGSSDDPTRISLMLIWSSLIAVLAFIFTKHYWAVDARYLTIVLFAGVIAVATWGRSRHWQSNHLVGVGMITTIFMVAGVFFVINSYRQYQAPLADYSQRNLAISQSLAHHHADVLIGNYWRVVPVKLASNGHQKVMPLSACNQPQTILNSTSWQPDLTKHSFAYVYTLDNGLNGFKHCSLNEITAQYGRPNASVLISGTLQNPKSMLLFYDHGIERGKPASPRPPSTVVPINLNDLKNTACDKSTILNVVAHQDDDILFMNPDLIHDVQAGNCIRTIYVTAGDAGSDLFYWLSREQAAEAAYGSMLGQESLVWINRLVKTGDHQFVSIASPAGYPNISLIFMKLPDGNLGGQGFTANHYESIVKLQDNNIAYITSVDKQSTYTSQQLVDALVAFMRLYQPTEIRSQSNFNSKKFPDHSDHQTVGRYVKQAYAKYEEQQYNNQTTIPIHFYIGYPTQDMPINVSSADLALIKSAFDAYNDYDKSVCQTDQECEASTYGKYFSREYRLDY